MMSWLPGYTRVLGMGTWAGRSDFLGIWESIFCELKKLKTQKKSTFFGESPARPLDLRTGVKREWTSPQRSPERPLFQRFSCAGGVLPPLGGARPIPLPHWHTTPSPGSHERILRPQRTCIAVPCFIPGPLTASRCSRTACSALTPRVEFCFL